MAQTSLVIGGTGMLAMATNWLVAQSDLTVLVSRHAKRFAAGNPTVQAIEADWNHPRFRHVVTDGLSRASGITHALLWIHDIASALDWLMPLLGTARVVVILGSTDGKPIVPETFASPAFVRLGSMSAGAGRRWLTHEEISLGAIAALQDGKSRTIGDLLPLN